MNETGKDWNRSHIQYAIYSPMVLKYHYIVKGGRQIHWADFMVLKRHNAVFK